MCTIVNSDYCCQSAGDMACYVNLQVNERLTVLIFLTTCLCLSSLTYLLYYSVMCGSSVASSDSLVLCKSYCCCCCCCYYYFIVFEKLINKEWDDNQKKTKKLLSNKSQCMHCNKTEIFHLADLCVSLLTAVCFCFECPLQLSV